MSASTIVTRNTTDIPAEYVANSVGVVSTLIPVLFGGNPPLCRLDEAEELVREWFLSNYNAHTQSGLWWDLMYDTIDTIKKVDREYDLKGMIQALPSFGKDDAYVDELDQLLAKERVSRFIADSLIRDLGCWFELEGSFEPAFYKAVRELSDPELWSLRLHYFIVTERFIDDWDFPTKLDSENYGDLCAVWGISGYEEPDRWGYTRRMRYELIDVDAELTLQALCRSLGRQAKIELTQLDSEVPEPPRGPAWMSKAACEAWMFDAVL